ncbi:M48 family metalloprotease [Achromobacter piechaudii]|uniref:Beta-barrel assembly-enhancing protease n=3 Tax=Achromobacter TaxID=222 RepID=A0A6S7EC48_9BURK|nr:peptidase, M48 family [Achromobacter piechaudii ATCC 43553]CAB3710700.1 Beta-barrel assembly-enhancing protease [Achromobacter piechaudii]CAB3876528.1 Beta-barrel assembly-enhancing protease [Achromobacter piechaudii]CAB3901760.1 Beta-barrel assembly-enhancing protease [Achromobacter piechaudii]CAB3953528.1 Beta-barrel assembly-enhancing protease [Achromobacter piechaudii]
MPSICAIAKRSAILGLSVALIAPSIPVAAWAQPVGLPSMGAASAAELSPMLERSLGQAIMSQGRRDPTYVDDPELSQYLTTMGRKLAAFAPGAVPDVEMFGVRDPEINAFAMPGGYIGVNTGLIVSSGSESELAAVLAHEIGHVVQRHIARGMTQQNQNGMVMLASLAGALLAALAGGGGNLAMGVAAFGQAAAINRQLGFSRDAEREADRAGFQMLTKAGYDAEGMSQMFSRLMNASRLNEGAGGGSWASTHPLSIERMSDVQNRVRSLPASRHIDSDDFWYVRAKMRVVQGRDAVSLRSAGQQLQDEAQALSGVRQSAAYYGLALQAFQRNNLAEADRYWNLATAGGRNSAQLAKLSVDIALARKENARALELAQAATKRWPEQRALGIAYAQALQSNGRHADAQDYLRAKIKQWGSDEPSLYQMLAQSEERNGKPVQARRDLARFYVMTGAFAAAESQLQQARGLSTDFYEQSQIDVQIKEVKDKLAEERQLLERFKSG